jgi:hypothetical protein
MEQVGLERLGSDTDWEPPGPQPRTAARLLLPGNECVYQIVGYETVPPEPSDPANGDVQGFAPPVAAPPDAVAPPVVAPPTTVPPAPETTTTTTTPPKPILAPVDAGTTIAPNVLDPRAPLPSVPLNAIVRPCR